MALEGLRSVLQSQANANKRIVVSASTVQDAQLAARNGFDELVRSRLMLPGDLVLDFEGQVAPATDKGLSFSGKAGSLFGVNDVTVAVVFLEHAEIVDVQVVVELDSWTLGAAFPALNRDPFSRLALSTTRYVVTTAASGSFTWSDAERTIGRGAMLFGLLPLDGPLEVVLALLKDTDGKKDPLMLTGTVEPPPLESPAQVPLLDLKADIGHEIAIPHFELTTPRMEIATVVVGEEERYCSLMFATTLDIEKEPFCHLKAAILTDLSMVIFSLHPIDTEPAITLPRVAKLLGAPDDAVSIPPELASVFANIALTGFSATVALRGPDGSGPRLVDTSAALGTVTPWNYGEFHLEQLTLRVLCLSPIGSGPVLVWFEAKACLFPGTAMKDEFDLLLNYDTGTKELSVSAAMEGRVSIHDVLSALSKGSVTVPAGWSMSINRIGVTFAKPQDGKATYMLWAAIDAGFPIPLLGVHVDSDVQLLVDSAQDRFKLSGGMTVADSRFQIEVDLSRADKVVSGSWDTSGDDYFKLEPLLHDLHLDSVYIPAGLDLNLKSAELRYDITNSLLTIEASSATYGDAVLAALKGPAGWTFFFGLKVPREIRLGDLPLIGKELDKVVDVAIDDIEVLVSSAIDRSVVGTINDAINALKPGYPQAPAEGMKGVALSMSFVAGGEKTTLRLATPPDTKPVEGERGGMQSPAAPSSGQGAALAQTTAASPQTPSSTSSDGTIWIDVKKTFGPVTFDKVGIRYGSGSLTFLMNASISGAGLGLAVIGLGVSSPLDSFQPKFTIEGIAITFAEGPVQMSGAMLGSLDPVNFYGELIMGIGELKIAAIGGYAEAQGHPSLFLYAVLDYPIGGPEFFFVTGLSAGFGYNRKLVLPPVEGVESFPLVQWAEGSGNPPPTNTTSIAEAIAKVVSQLSTSGVIAPSLGDDWVAVGVKFTSFELVKSSAVLTIIFGTHFEVALLGTSTVQLPASSANPVAKAKLELEATFTPASGVLAITGHLTPDSYVLSRACHLSGGFAFYSWLGGPHEGEFVMTFGGYSPRFSPPSHYPVVPRLGLNWQVTSELSVRGELYFALTSGAVMAGGKMNAVWQRGDIRAWFNVDVDFLLVFEPFHYYASAGIQLGATFTVDLKLTKITKSIQVGVGIEIWGPEFTGKVKVDLSVISFTITFGAGEKNTKTQISWQEFLDKLMPGGRKAEAPRGLESKVSDTGAAADYPIVQILPGEGLLKRLSDADGHLNWVVSASTFKLVTQSAIPIKKWAFDGSNIRLADGVAAARGDFGVGPTGTSAESFQSTHTIAITAEEPGSVFVATPLRRNIPAALWQPRKFDSNGVPQGVDPVNNTTLPDATVGFALEPLPLDAKHTLPVPLANLRYTIEQGQNFGWSDAVVPPDTDYAAEPVWKSIGAPGATAARTALITTMGADGFALSHDVDVSELATESAYDLLATPAVRVLGERR